MNELKLAYINEDVRQDILIDYIYEHIFAELNEFTLLSNTSAAKNECMIYFISQMY